MCGTEQLWKLTPSVVFVNELAAFLPSTTNTPKSEENTCQSDRLELLGSDKPQLTMEGGGTMIYGAVRLSSDDETD